MLPLGPRIDIAKGPRELGRRLGVSHSAVIRAEKGGRIKALPDGSYDVAACRVDWEANTHRTRPSALTDPGLVTSPSGSAASGDGVPLTTNPGSARGRERIDVSPEATGAVAELLREHGVDLSGDPSLRDAATAREIVRVYRERLALAKDQGEVVERTKVYDVLMTFSRTMRTEIMGWPRRAAAAIASELGLTDPHVVELVLENSLRPELDRISRVPAPDQLLPPPS